MSAARADRTFGIEKIYVKDLSLEVPGGPQTFMQPSTTAGSFRSRQQSQARDNELLFEVTLVITVSAKTRRQDAVPVEASQRACSRSATFPMRISPRCWDSVPERVFPYAARPFPVRSTRGGFSPGAARTRDSRRSIRARQARGGAADGPSIENRALMRSLRARVCSSWRCPPRRPSPLDRGKRDADVRRAFGSRQEALSSQAVTTRSRS